MHSIQFWKSWAKVYQRIGLLSAGAFALALLYLWFAWFQSPGPVFSWLEVQEQELIQIPVHSFQQGLLELNVLGDTYLIFERLLGSSLKPNPFAGYFFLAMLSLAMVFLLTIVTTLRKFWYLLGMGFFILAIAGFRMEIIQMFGLSNKIFTIVVLTLYVIPSFYFQFFRPGVSFLVRLMVFSLITVAVVITIVNFASVPRPLLHLSVTGITVGITLSVVFIFMVAHEILASFVYVASQSAKQSKSLNHFLIISVIYFVNLALAYAHKIGMIDWDFLYINFYLLLTLSGVLGIWGFRHREPQYESILAADPFGVYFFLSLGTIAFATIGYFIGTANDAALVTINDAIIYGHLGYGIIFLTYVLSNFIVMLAKNLPVYKVLYKPNNMPYFTFRFGGLIATLAFVFYNAWQVPVQNAFGAYFNAGGDLYQAIGNPQYAEAFYQQAGAYGFLNHHANYAIANIEGRRLNTLKERNFFKRAGELRPTEFSILNYAHTFQRDGEWLQSLLALKDAQKKFPDSGPIQNTIGLSYSKLNLPDSALFFIQEAMEHPATRDAAQTNFIGVAARNNFAVHADSLLILLKSENAGTKSNALAFANLQGTKIELSIDPHADTVLNLFTASLINNYLLNHLGETDTTEISKVIALAKKPVNEDFREAVLYSSALACYADGQIGKAFSLLEEVTIASRDQSKYNTMLTLWALEQQAYHDADGFAKYILSDSYGPASPVVAIALSEAGRIGEALVQWDTLRRSQDTTYQHFAQQMINALASNRSMVNQFSEEEKFLFAWYRIPLNDSVSFINVVNSIENDDLKARAILLRSRQLFELDETQQSIALFQRVKGLQLSDRRLYDQIIHFELDLFAKRREITALANQINNLEVTFSKEWENQQNYFKALLSELNGDSTEASRLYRWLSTINPYDEEAVIAAAQYFKNITDDPLTTYNILADALHANQFSVKLLKAYSLEAARLNFDTYAQSSLERLRPLMSPQSLRDFLAQNQETFQRLIQ